LRLFSIDDNPYINEKATVLRESLLGKVKKPSIKVKNQNTDIVGLVAKEKHTYFYLLIIFSLCLF